MGVATHKVLMCQPYDIYCLGGGGKATFLYPPPPPRPSPTTFIIAASSWWRQLAARRQQVANQGRRRYGRCGSGNGGVGKTVVYACI